MGRRFLFSESRQAGPFRPRLFSHSCLGVGVSLQRHRAAGPGAAFLYLHPMQRPSRGCGKGKREKFVQKPIEFLNFFVYNKYNQKPHTGPAGICRHLAGLYAAALFQGQKGECLCWIR